MKVLDASLRACWEELAWQGIVWLGPGQARDERVIAMDKTSKFRKYLQTFCKINKYLIQIKNNNKKDLPNNEARLAKIFISIR